MRTVKREAWVTCDMHWGQGWKDVLNNSCEARSLEIFRRQPL